MRHKPDASRTHYFLLHGLVDTPDRVGDSSVQPCRLQNVGRLGAEVEGPLLDNNTFSPNAHPWALQLKAESIQAWEGNMRKPVMDEECRTLFCDIDFGDLRMRALYLSCVHGCTLTHFHKTMLQIHCVVEYGMVPLLYFFLQSLKFTLFF